MNLYGFVASLATKPCEFIRFGGIHGPKLYDLIGVGGIPVPNPHEFIRFGCIHGPKSYEFHRVFVASMAPNPTNLQGLVTTNKQVSRMYPINGSWDARAGPYVPPDVQSCRPYEFMGFGAMDVTKPYEFIVFGAMDVTKPYQFIGFGAMDVTKPYQFIGFGAVCTSRGSFVQSVSLRCA